LREQWQAKPKEGKRIRRGANLLSAQPTTHTNPKKKVTNLKPSLKILGPVSEPDTEPRFLV
jgi:hypothetical protein